MQLNEWNFAVKAIELIQANNEAVFQIDPNETFNVGPSAFQGTLIDEEGKKYSLNDDESSKMFYELLVTHDYEYDVDYTKNEVVIKPK